jgi:hypothetical protein
MVKHQHCRGRNHCLLDTADAAGSMLAGIDMKLLLDAAPNQAKLSGTDTARNNRYPENVLTGAYGRHQLRSTCICM